jgi:two-component system NtrC family sensor kinase
MSSPGRGPRFSFQSKVLAPVLGALVLLPAVTLWIVNGYITRQVQDESRQTLDTADAVFLNSLNFRARDLSRFQNAVNEPRFKATAQLGDARTMFGVLHDLLGELPPDNEIVLFTTDHGQRLAAAARDSAVPLDDFEHAAWAITQQALAGETGSGTVSVGGRTHIVVAVPVQINPNSPPVGALTIATRIGETTIQELKLLVRADILLVAGNTVTASTIRQPDLPGTVLAEITETGPANRRKLPVVIQGEHFLALTDKYEQVGPQRGFRYVLLSSYETRLRELKSTQTALLAVSLVGVLLSALMVWILIRRITRPLLTLRDTAEAVGRGDFTRRVENFSDDECGELAEAFNRMTANLQASRADLEKAVGTLKATQAQLIQSEKLSAVGQFVAGIAHELNNPLTSVVGFSELLQSQDLEPKYKNHLDHIARAAIRCHKIVHSLLGFSRQQEPERKLVLLHNVVDAVLEIVSYDMRTNNVTVERNFAPELPPILADAHQLQQVILNILSNARQAMEGYRRDGRIVLSTGTTGTQVWLRIKDNGPGMRKEVLSRIFDPFFTTKAQGKGTGLGLSLSYGIIQEHQGSIRAESEPGDGAEFIIELPAADASAAVSADARGRSAAPFKPNSPALNVLAVDDEESILHLVQEVLRAEGHNVTGVTSGQAALELVARHRYDVIVSDWKMPGLSGMHVFEDLSTKDPATAARMLFMTGDVVNDKFQEFLKKNNRICLPKPFSIREFRAAVDKLAREK